jgi:FtsH-binding integral membrane protein
MYTFNLIALLVMSIVIIILGIIITGVLMNKKYNNKTKTLYMGITGFLIIAILIAFFYLIPTNFKNL